MMKNSLDICERINHIIDNQYNGNKKKFAETIGYSPQVVSNIVSGRKSKPSYDVINAIASTNDEISLRWLIKGEGELLKKDLISDKKINLIPFYDDVESIGGNNYVADMNGIGKSTDYIDAGDWFPNVTAAIRHYNDSMLEYPSGCILALKKINEIHSIVWGSNYVIETSEMRITKRMQTAADDKYIMAYSTNTETYPDGKQIHEPKKILKTDIKNIFLVLGRIVKEHSSGPVFTSK